MNEIKFRRDTSFRKQFFTPESFSHPAKMDSQLLIWIVEKFTKEGETILDPMAGSGTSMLACGLGRNVVLVELEEKFCKMMRDNWAEVKMRPQLGYEMGDCQIIQGDARHLEGLVDKIISSPPYGNRLSDAEVDDGDPQRMSYRQALGKVDKIITSPPYALTVQKGHEGVQAWKVIEGLKNADNKTLREKSKELTERGIIVNQYGDNPDNLGNLPYGNIDAVVTSPPYEDYTCKGNSSTAREHNIGQSDYGKAEGQIGNLKSTNYLEAMLQVYQSCFNVLKDEGLMILVTKNFIRNKQVIRLDFDTIKLCEQAGFQYLERYYRKLPAQSFWRTIYYKKHPEVERLDYEDVLVLRKENAQ